MIPNGATIWARQTMDSEIYQKPDKWFKIWFYIVSRVNHKAKGKFKRGQCFMKYQDIIDTTGATKDQVKHCIEFLKCSHMIATQKATRGMIVTVLNYDTYQSLSNYESHGGNRNKATQKPHYKQECKNVQEKEGVQFPDVLNTSSFREAWSSWEQHRTEIRKKLTPRAISMQLKMLAENHTKAIGIIETSIRNGWTGLFPDKAKNEPQRSHPPVR